MEVLFKHQRHVTSANKSNKDKLHLLLDNSRMFYLICESLKYCDASL